VEILHTPHYFDPLSDRITYERWLKITGHQWPAEFQVVIPILVSDDAGWMTVEVLPDTPGHLRQADADIELLDRAQFLYQITDLWVTLVTADQRKVLTPNDFVDLVEVEQRLLGFQRRYQQTAQPFDWRYTRSDLDQLLRRLDDRQQLTNAA
jgi:hypothetical protein